MRIVLPSLNARVALTGVAAGLGLTPPKFTGNSVSDLYAAESTLIQSQRVIPLLHIRSSYALSAIVKDWGQDPDALWRLPEVWLGTEKP